MEQQYTVGESVTSKAFASDVRPLLDLIDRLSDLLGYETHDISLPQIAVIGDQSAGKSSVLEALSSLPFPRGVGLVTRCPTQIAMKRSSDGVAGGFKAKITVSGRQHQPEEAGTVDSVEALGEKIVALTNVLTRGIATNFSTETIVIQVTSPQAPDLTIVDLPGIVRTTTAGQSISIVAEVNNLIESYISMNNTIILAVIPSNQDIATIDVLERALKVDPQGVRTIGVLTKPDLIGPGGEDEVVQVLRNVRKPLQLGYFMVKNPSQKQINEGIDVNEAKNLESEYFKNHPFFSKLPASLFGAANLTTQLTKLLVANKGFVTNSQVSIGKKAQSSAIRSCRHWERHSR